MIPVSTPRVLHHARVGKWFQANASGTTMSAPTKSPRSQVRHTVGRLSRLMTPPAHDVPEPMVALKAVPIPIETTRQPTPRTVAIGEPAWNELPENDDRHDDFEQVADRLAQRRADRQGGVAVREQVPDDDAGCEAKAAEVEECDADADREPDDRRDRAGDLEDEAELRYAVIGAGEHGDPARVGSRVRPVARSIARAAISDIC